METREAYYITKIRENLSSRQRMNPHYSLRSYSRDLGLHSSTLSQIMKGKRALPLKSSHQITSKLGLGPKEKTLFLESLYRTKTRIDDIEIDPLDERFMLDESYFKVIAEWEHFAVLSLCDVKDFKGTIAEICERLGINENRAELVLQNLLFCGLLKRDGEKLLKVQPDIRTTEDIKSQALKESHLETLEMSKRKLEEIEVELRDYSSTTVALDLEKLPEAKTIIREFRQKMSALLRGGDKTEVYQLGIQFYPLTKQRKKELS